MATKQPLDYETPLAKPPPLKLSDFTPFAAVLATPVATYFVAAAAPPRVGLFLVLAIPFLSGIVVLWCTRTRD